MRTTDFAHGEHVTELRFGPHSVPHGTIELNRRCNLHCSTCYNISQGPDKPLALVCEEIETLIRLRNVQTITLLGGEPTLYPALNEAISFVKSKERFCQLLTNGVRFTQPGGAEYLDRLKANGIDRILLHIDESQADVRGTYAKDQEVIAGLCNERQIHCGLSLTLFPGQPATIPGSVRRLSRFAYFDGLISILAQDPQIRISGSTICSISTTPCATGLQFRPSCLLPDQSTGSASPGCFITFSSTVPRVKRIEFRSALYDSRCGSIGFSKDGNSLRIQLNP
jgi:hypothetical protein